MNLGQAAAVVMYEVGRGERKRNDNAETQRAQRSGGRPKRAGLKASATLKNAEKEGFAEMETVERIGEALLEALGKSGYIAARGEATAEEKLRRMLRRFSMEAADAEVLLGMARKILWKLEQE
jgi:tRNA C32,U32 (ribose-2'-O)-methylase TrmJ